MFTIHGCKNSTLPVLKHTPRGGVGKKSRGKRHGERGEYLQEGQQALDMTDNKTDYRRLVDFWATAPKWLRVAD